MTDIANKILAAQTAGFQVHEDEEMFWITTPKAPRRPSELLGSWKTSQAAWRCAALIHARLGELS